MTASDIPDFIEAVVNKKTSKVFALLDAIGDRFQVVSPEGRVSSLPEALFDEDLLILKGEQISESLTEVQISQVVSFNRKADAEADRIENAKKIQQAELAAAKAAPEAPAKRRSGLSRKKKPDIRVGKGAAWSSPRLTFYRHHISPVGPKQTLEITVTGLGTFKMTRHEFETTFNEVVMSQSYRKDGLFTYDQIPDKALAFKVS